MIVPDNGSTSRTSKAGKTGGKGALGAEILNLGSVRPFRTYFRAYLAAGWHPIPLPSGKKAPPPVGYTGGRFDGIADEAQCEAWIAEESRSGRLRYGERANLGFRAPAGVLGIDVDNYSNPKTGAEKVGAESLAELVAEYGELPDTWITTARADGQSGIRWFRVPPELAWPGKLGRDIESIWHRYRFAVAPPSIHPTLKTPYLWYEPGQALDGRGSLDAMPTPDELPELPASWIEGMKNEIWGLKPYDSDATDEDLEEWVLDLPDGEMCPQMRRAADSAVAEIESGGGAHDTLNSKVHHVVLNGAEGHPGARTALGIIREAFLREVTDRGRAGTVRSSGEAAREYKRTRNGGIRLALAQLHNEAVDRGVDEVDLPDECTCYIPAIGDYGEDPQTYDRNDIGNAEQLVDCNPDSLHYVPGIPAWVAWDEEEGHWRSDADNIVTGLAVDIGKRIIERGKELYEHALGEAKKDRQQQGADEVESERAAAGDDDVKKAKSLIKWGLNSGNKSRIRNMVELAASLSGITIPASALDADPNLLACPNGVLDLRTGRLRHGTREDLITRCTSVPYVGESSLSSGRGGVWSKFLRVSVPDRDVRAYLQKLAGMSLFGHNSERIFVFLVGPTGSGKSIFTETIISVLGDYAGPFPLSLFRDNQDDKHRSDIVAALPRRFVGTAEASRAWSLHADQIKRITGGDLISARAPYGRALIERRPAFTPWVSTNQTPTISGIDSALRRRLRAVRFPRTVAGSSADAPGLKERLAAIGPDGGAEEVLAWLVEGAARYRDEGIADLPNAVAEELSIFATEAAGHLGEWFEETFSPEPGEFVVMSEVMQHYSTWCDIASVPSRERVSMTKLGLFLAEQGFNKTQKKVDGINKKVRWGLTWDTSVVT